MGTMVYSLLWALQGLYHQPQALNPKPQTLGPQPQTLFQDLYKEIIVRNP